MLAWIGYIAVIIIGLGAVIGAMRATWIYALRPMANFITLVGEMKPLLEELTNVFKDNPNGFKVLDEIQAEFRTDSGSSLRDKVNEIAEAAKEAKLAADELKIGAAAQKQLAEGDRQQREQLMLKIDRMNERAKEVAVDLAASHKRASETINGEAGAAADAAAQLPEKEKEKSP